MNDIEIGCVCPPLDGAPRHPDGDTVTLRERLDFRSAFAIRNEFMLRRVEGTVPLGEALAMLTEGYLLYGIETWTLADEKGKPIPVSRAAIQAHILSQPAEAGKIAEAADALYGPIILPLVLKESAFSPPMPTGGSTSATADSPETPTPSSPSSTSTIPTDATATTSSAPVGDSSSSPS